MDRADYEWHYFIGGNCALKRRKYGGVPLAIIQHVEQGVYEAYIVRGDDLSAPWSLGVFTDSNEAQEAVEQALQHQWEN